MKTPIACTPLGFRLGPASPTELELARLAVASAASPEGRRRGLDNVFFSPERKAAVYVSFGSEG